MTNDPNATPRGDATSAPVAQPQRSELAEIKSILARIVRAQNTIENYHPSAHAYTEAQTELAAAMADARKAVEA